MADEPVTTAESLIAEDGVVELTLPTPGFSGDVVAYNAAGEVVPTPHRIIVKPYFSRGTSAADLLYTRVGRGSIARITKELGRFVIRLGGVTGRFKICEVIQHAPTFVDGK